MQSHDFVGQFCLWHLLEWPIDPKYLYQRILEGMQAIVVIFSS